jgi:hypothetical protein
MRPRSALALDEKIVGRVQRKRNPPSSRAAPRALASVQIHSEDSLGKSRPRLTKVSATPAKAGAHATHGSRPSREDENRRIPANEP